MIYIRESNDEYAIYYVRKSYDPQGLEDFPSDAEPIYKGSFEDVNKEFNSMLDDYITKSKEDKSISMQNVEEDRFTVYSHNAISKSTYFIAPFKYPKNWHTAVFTIESLPRRPYAGLGYECYVSVTDAGDLEIREGRTPRLCFWPADIGYYDGKTRINDMWQLDIGDIVECVVRYGWEKNQFDVVTFRKVS